MKFHCSKLLRFFASLILIFCFTACYNDTALWRDVNKLRERVTDLETTVNQLNWSIQTLKNLVSALESKVYVESVLPSEEGYTLVFSNGTVAKLRHGTQGQDGQTPIVAAALFNQVYCWTVTYGQTTSWLTDAQGNKLPVCGKDGSDGLAGEPGITPELKIDDEGYWRIRYGASSDFQYLTDSQGKAISAIGPRGEDGKDGADGEDGKDGDSFFQELKDEDDCIRLILTNGQEICLPKASPRLDIFFDSDDDSISCSSGEVVSIGYTLSYGNRQTLVRLLPYEGWEARLEATDETHGRIIVTAPDPVCDGEILVLVSDGGEKTILRSLCFVSGQLQIAKDLYTVDHTASSLQIPIHTDLSYHCELGGASWITLQNPALRSAFHDDTLTLKIQSNPGQVVRKADVKLVNNNGHTIRTIRIWQANGSLNANEIHYSCSDADTLEVDFSGFRQQRISHLMFGQHGIISFDGKIDHIGEKAFYKQRRLISLRLPAQIRSIGDYAFYGCYYLNAFLAPDMLETIGNNAFGSCYVLPSLEFPEGFKSLGDGCFMDDRALSSVYLPATTEKIGSYAFKYCHQLSEVHCLAPEPPVLGQEAFSDNADKLWFYVPSEWLEIYEDNLFWKGFAPYLTAEEE